MSAPFPPIHAEVLRRAAGGGAYARGLAYHQTGRVELLSTGPSRALAIVRGTEAYQVEVVVRAGEVGGACECRAFEDSGFCKHMVAAALAAGESPAVDRLAGLRSHLLAQPHEALVARILRLAERDGRLRGELEREAADGTDDDAALAARYRRAIDEATDSGGGVDYWGAASYAEEIAAVVAALEALAQAGRGGVALDLVEYLLERIGEGIEETDDSEGEVFAVGERACALHLALCRSARPDPVALAGRLFKRAMDSTTDLFGEPDESYAEVLGEIGLAEFRRLAREAWQALPPPKRQEYDGRRYSLRSILDRAAKATGDIEARSALRDLTNPTGYDDVASIWLEAGRPDEALRWLEDGLWAFEGEHLPRLQQRAASLMRDQDRTADAVALLWRMFERQPSLAIFRDLAQLPQEAPPAVRAMAMLQAQAAKSARQGAYINGPAATLFDLQLETGEIDAAWETVTAWGVGENRLTLLAERSIASHPQRAATAFAFLAESRVKSGGAENYDAAVRLIRRRGEACANPADQAAFIADMRLRHKAKRTFIQRLQTLA
jgi:uncharacterized Zn finger protein